MKNLLRLTFIFLIFLSGCSNDNNSDTNPFGIEANSENITFQVSIQQDPQHGTYFHFNPSVDIKVIKIVGTFNNQTYNVDGDANTIMTVAEGFSVEASNPETGDQWYFTISGKIASNNSDFTSTVNYTIPTGFGGTASNVSFEISSQAGQQGDIEFLFKPNVDVTILKVDVEMGGSTDLINGDDTTVYTANTLYVLAGYNGVESGQNWSFKFTGKIYSSKQDYNVTVNYTVP